MPAPRPRTTRLLGGRDAAQGAAPGTRRPGGGSSAVGSPTPARTFSGRFLLLTLVAVLIVFLAAPTTKIWLEQRAEIAALEQSIADMEAEQASLEDRVDQWSDETYVKQQARDRLLYVMPGERSYLVVGAEEMEGAVVDSSAAQVEAEKPAWVDALWDSVVASAYEDAAAAPETLGTEDTTGTADTTGTDETTGTDSTDSIDSTGTGTTDGTGAAEDTGGAADAGTPVPADGAAEGTPAPTGGTDEPQDAATDSRGTAAE
ncbi:septum formation initiator family protein [Kocuria sp. SM24M-10]|uniref:FtsB family cell division protein n=1 Tax=Kocuria sp. SM24M-10 TaxID=1660349 RepID=UPI0009E4BD9D|nr:septum formation initiator family protein [Kocuria sp. SM24M-10]